MKTPTVDKLVRMQIRWKLLILLLTIALTPLAVVSGLSVYSMQSLGQDLAIKVRDSLANDATNQLEQLIGTYSATIASNRDSIELALRLQASEVEKALAIKTPHPVKVWTTLEFDNNNPELTLTTDEHHTRVDFGGEHRPIRMSFDEQAYYTPPGIEPSNLRSDMRRLATMTPLYQSLQSEHQDMIHWQYTALENGLHSTYPGHGEIPQDYDPRERPWYRSAISANNLIWNQPIVDASTRQVMLTVSAPVSRPNGALAGVTAIDVRMLDIVDLVNLPEAWRDGAEVFLVVRSETPGAETGHLAILAQREPASEGARWDIEPAQEWLDSTDDEPFQAMFEDMTRGATGVQTMRHGDHISLWAYGSVDKRDAQLVVIVPRKLIVADAMSAEDAALKRTTTHLQYIGLVLLAALILIAAVALVGSRTVTEPIRSLVEAANHIADGNLEVRVAINTGDELEDLGDAFNSMAPKLRDRVRMLDSLSLASEVQQSLLPGAAPKVPGIDIAGRSVYCDETGGDYYDFFDFRAAEKGSLGLVVGDVSGHGIASALLMASTRALLHSDGTAPASLSSLISVINNQLSRDSAQGRFMTLAYLMLDVEDCSIRYVSAGHDPTLVYIPGEDRFEELRTDDIPLGITEDWEYREYHRASLNPGEVLVIATDGVWDTRSEEGKLFGKERFNDVIRNNAQRSANEIINAVIGTLNRFRKTEPQRDDITLVIIKGE